MRNVLERQPAVKALVLPNFYETDFTALPTTIDLEPSAILRYLEADPAKHGALIDGKVAVWNSAEGQAPEGHWYIQELPLEDPGDATCYETADEALYEAMCLAI